MDIELPMCEEYVGGDFTSAVCLDSAANMLN
jgi:hypothetical protein